MPLIFGHPGHLVVVGGALALCLGLFVFWFLVPAARQSSRLGKAIKALEAATDRTAGAAVGKLPGIAHLWNEYSDTLHEQRELNPQTGQFEVTKIRSSVPAEAFFTQQALVDTPLKAEFFKHLPGILTGLGIIGTFTGLITGLTSFNVSDNPDEVRRALNGLVGGVYEAFAVSAIAIGLAMFTTFIEKMFVAHLYKKVERICQRVDGLYQAGAGEEYLSRLVIASEASAKEAKQLKQSLVDDLKHLLEEVTERQIAATNASSNLVAERIVAGMSEGLKEPLAEIRSAVQQVSGDQGTAVHKLLADTMTAMTAQIRDLFGSQLTGINQMQQQTLDAMTAAVGKLQQVVSDMSDTGERTTEAMGEKLAKAIEAMEGRQSAMDAQVRQLLTDVQEQIGRANGDTNQKLKEAMAAVTETVGEAVRNLQAMVDKAGNRDVVRTQAMEKATSDAVSSISAEVKALVATSAAASEQMGNAVAAMQRLTTDSVVRMSQGADRLYAASEKFAEAGGATAGVLNGAQLLLKQMSDTSGALTGSATTLNAAINDYKATRDSLAQMVTALQKTVESAKTEAALTENVLSRINRSAEALQAAEVKAQAYLEEVSEVLAKAHQEFGDQVITTLSKLNGEFHSHLESATKSLAGAIEDLEGVFDKIPS